MESFKKLSLKIGVLSSHGGSGMQAVHRAIEGRKLAAEIVMVISNNSDSGVLKFAIQKNLLHKHMSRKTEGGLEAFDIAICTAMMESGADLIILSGWMQLVGGKTLAAFPIINIHPALRDSGYEGQGFYGDRVHAAVIKNKGRAGATIHLVDKEYDNGKVLAMQEVVVEKGETVESLREKVKALEQVLIVEVLFKIIRGEISIN